MKKLLQLTIRQKMMLVLGVTLVGMVTIAVLMLVGFSRVRHQQEVMEQYTIINNTALRGSVAMLKAREAENEFFNRHFDKWIDRVKLYVGQANGQLDEIDRINHDPKVKEWTAKARSLAGKYSAQFEAVAATAKKADFRSEAYADEREELLDVINEFQPLLDTYIPKQVGAELQAARKNLDSVMSSTRIQILVVVVIIALVMVALLGVITAQLGRSLKMVVERMHDIAEGEGDLTKRIELMSNDELGELASCFNTFIEKLHGVIGQVADDTRQVAHASAMLQTAAAQMATGSEEVAAQAGTVAAASEQMSATSTEIAGNCSRVAESSTRAEGAARDGSAVVQGTVRTMNLIAENVKQTAATVASLGEQSSTIGNIIGTIEDIADQTNLLALNAAIEAARAGEQGRGFAVVADEVRALSERTTRATKEIAQVIKGVQQETRSAVAAMEQGVCEVEKGTVEAARSGEALEAILRQVQSVTEQVRQIAGAAEEQTSTTCSISSNIHQISQVVTGTSHGASDSAEAASRLAELAENLQRQVGRFRL